MFSKCSNCGMSKEECGDCGVPSSLASPEQAILHKIAQDAHLKEVQKDKCAKAFQMSRERWDHIEDLMNEMLYPNFYA